MRTSEYLQNVMMAGLGTGCKWIDFWDEKPSRCMILYMIHDGKQKKNWDSRIFWVKLWRNNKEMGISR